MVGHRAEHETRDGGVNALVLERQLVGDAGEHAVRNPPGLGDDPLSTWKVVTRTLGDSSAPKSVFSSRICAESMERLWSLAGATSGNRW